MKHTAPALLLVLACSRRVDTAASIHEAIKTDTDTAASVAVVTRTVEAPDTITTTVEDYDEHAGGVGPAAPARLIRRTVRVEQRGPVTVERRSDAQAATETHAATTADSTTTTHTKTRAGPSWFGLIGIGAALALVLSQVWRFRKLLGIPL